MSAGPLLAAIDDLEDHIERYRRRMLARKVLIFVAGMVVGFLLRWVLTP